jgi:hypothetical protein
VFADVPLDAKAPPLDFRLADTPDTLKMPL